MKKGAYCYVCGYENYHLTHVIHWIEEFRKNLKKYNRLDACVVTNRTQGTANTPLNLHDLVYVFSDKHTEDNRFFDFILDTATDEDLGGVLNYLKKAHGTDA